MSSTVLVVDDDPKIRTMITWRLEAEGFKAVPLGTGTLALEAVADELPDLVILDLSLPDVSGLDVLTHLRAESDLPVIIVSGRAGASDKIAGLDFGADDYLGKPFSPDELAARVRSVLRRGRERPARETIEAGPLRIDLLTREVFLDDEPVEMSPKEFELLAFLASSPRRAFTREQLLRDVWRSSSSWQTEKTVTQHIHRLRQKLGRDPGHPDWLRTVSRVGYRFDPGAGR